jgi:hypothetical protein
MIELIFISIGCICLGCNLGASFGFGTFFLLLGIGAYIQEYCVKPLRRSIRRDSKRVY